MFRLLKILSRRTPNTFKPVILITGCGSGLGLATADLLYRHKNYRVVITARDSSIPFLKSRFNEDDRFWILPMDVTREWDRSTVIRVVESRWGGVNILINNAGISYRSVVEHMTEEDEQLQMATNYLGPLALTRLVLPHMRLVGRGKIINISSVSGMLAMPTMASYSASKHALEGASEALWYEAKPFGINVSVIQPGFIRSKSFERVYYSEFAKHSARSGSVYSDYYTNMGPFISRLMQMSLSTPAAVARKILDVIQTENPPLFIPATLDAIIFYHLRRILPRRLLQPILFFALPNAGEWAQLYSRSRNRPRRAAPEPTQPITYAHNVTPFRRTKSASTGDAAKFRSQAR